ncbi:MAG: fibronectin type III domain-containing protein, partial [Hyphomicrobiales bacterium]|nr:fibronectin type III domain-containing protein [Hyphomicrobiales bacterium]
MKITRLPVGAQFVLLVGLALGMFGFAAPALAQPGVPTDIMITPGDKSLAVSWTAPTNTGIGGILGYDVSWKLARGTAHRNASPCAAQYTITNLADGATYEVQVKALDFKGQESAWSSAVQATPLSAADLPPANVVPSAPMV